MFLISRAPVQDYRRNSVCGRRALGEERSAAEEGRPGRPLMKTAAALRELAAALRCKLVELDASQARRQNFARQILLVAH